MGRGKDEEGAWAEIVELHLEQVWGVSRAMVADLQAAERIVHDTFRAVRERLAGDPPAGALRPWILATCRRLALERRGRRGRRPCEVPAGLDAGRWVSRLDLERALAALAEDEQEAILLAAAGYTSEELAAAQGVAAPAVRARRSSARAKLLLLLDSARWSGR